jgi:hypothetical protein
VKKEGRSGNISKTYSGHFYDTKCTCDLVRVLTRAITAKARDGKAKAKDWTLKVKDQHHCRMVATMVANTKMESHS